MDLKKDFRSYESFLFDYVSKTENDDHENAIMKTHNEHCTNQPRELGNFRKAFDWVLLFFSRFFLVEEAKRIEI